MTEGKLRSRCTATEALAQIVAEIPSTFGRIVYLAGLREGATYSHYGLSLTHTPADVAAAAKKAHKAIFNEWLNFSLEEQHADIELYLATDLRRKRLTICNWAVNAPWELLPPASAEGPEIQLFSADLSALLKLYKRRLHL